MDIAPDLHDLGWCPFATVTGKPCILCGGTRAALAVVRGDLMAAWRFNASVLVLGALVVVMAGTEFARGGAPAVRARVHRLTATPPGRRVHLPMVVFFAVWWAWNFARW